MLAMSSSRTFALIAFALACISTLTQTDAFVPPSTKSIASSSTASSSSLYVFGNKSGGAAAGKSTKPTFDKATETWQPSPNDDGEYPYDAFGALLRHGPAPFIKRSTDPKGYEQIVLKYMAGTGCSRAEATGNMDAKLNNAADWAYQKMEEKKTGKKVDYTVLKKKDAALTAIWALGITPLVLNSVLKTIGQFGTGPSTIKYWE